MKKTICQTCGTVGEPKTRTRGSILIEFFLWLMLIVPGLIYSLWRLSTRAKVCRACGSEQITPTDTPLGQKLLRDLAASGHRPNSFATREIA